jgi:chromosome segregation ATPase
LCVRRPAIILVLVAALLGLVGAACGGGGEESAPSPAPAAPAEPSEVPTVGESGTGLEAQLEAIRDDVEQTADGLTSVGSLEELQAELDEAATRFEERADELAAQAGQVPEDLEDERAELESRLRQLSDDLAATAEDAENATAEDLPSLVEQVISAGSDALADIEGLADRLGA